MMEKSITFAEIRIPESLFANPAIFFLSQCTYASSVGVLSAAIALAATKGAVFRKSAAIVQRIAHEEGIFKPQRGVRQQDPACGKTLRQYVIKDSEQSLLSFRSRGENPGLWKKDLSQAIGMRCVTYPRPRMRALIRLGQPLLDTVRFLSNCINKGCDAKSAC